MDSMFNRASAFDQDISGWALHSVTTMEYMFNGASAFDQDLGWCLDSVDLGNAFTGTPCASTSCGILNTAALACDGAMTDSTIRTAVAAWLADATAAAATYGHISTWETSGGTDMSYLFCAWTNDDDASSGYCTAIASSFNDDISAWDTSSVTRMDYMFYYTYAWTSHSATSIGDWDVSNVRSMVGMFRASSFNQDISGWNVGAVTSMVQMFHSATSFNQDISDWSVDNVVDMSNMFYYASAFNQDISAWDTSGVTTMSRMFYMASAFDQNLGWCVDDDVNLGSAFVDTLCGSTSCGVLQAENSGDCASTGNVMANGKIRIAVARWLSDATAAEATYGHIR